MDVMRPAGLPREIVDHYTDRSAEQDRLQSGAERVEFLRTQETIRRFLPAATGLRILDVGGGAGAHAAWLANDGHDVHLIDPLDVHVEQALELSFRNERRFTAAVGDARALEQLDESFDAVLLLGPLYHLVTRGDRIDALYEAQRVLRPGGLVFASAISRFASLFDGMQRGYLSDPEYREIVERDLRTGQHRNPTNHPDWFTTAFFHHPDELEREAHDAGLMACDILGLESFAGWMALSDDADLDLRAETGAVLLEAARLTEGEPTLLGLSAHLLLVAQRPST